MLMISLCYVICKHSNFFLFFPQYLAFKPEMTPLMTFDPLSVNILYGALVNYYVKNISVEIGHIVQKKIILTNHVSDLCHEVRGHIEFKFISQVRTRSVMLVTKFSKNWSKHDRSVISDRRLVIRAGNQVILISPHLS